jgi:hypothetical protein
MTDWDAWLIRRWFTRRWWQSLLRGCRDWQHFRCRVRGHPHGVVWYTLSRDEPDMRCVDCGEDLG